MVLYIDFFKEGEFLLFEDVSSLRVVGERVEFEFTEGSASKGMEQWCSRERVRLILVDNRQAYISPVEIERQRRLAEAKEAAEQADREAEKEAERRKGFFKKLFEKLFKSGD